MSEVLVYTVWVGGIEVSEELHEVSVANDIADDWKRKGYDDVGVMSYTRQER